MLFLLEWHFLKEKKDEMTHPKETEKQIHTVNFFKNEIFLVKESVKV